MIIFIGFGVSLMVFFIFFWIFSNLGQKQLKAVQSATADLAPSSKTFSISSKDIETIAGDDLLTTQLDLARAYLETERKNLAKSILNNVVQQGSPEQQQEAKSLLAYLHLAT